MKFVLLFLLLFCNHARGHWLRCSTGVVITNQAISIPSSIHAGAKVSLLREHQASSLIYCLDECCSGKHGACSVVEFKRNSTDVNCFYYFCQPISKCRFMDSEGTDTFTFPSAGQNVDSTYNIIHNNDKDHDKLKEQSTTKSTTFIQLQQRTSNHELPVAARKGVEVTTAGNEGSLVSWGEELSTTHFENGDSSKSFYTSKEHTRTVTARKGVPTISSSPNAGSSVSFFGPSTEEGDSLKSSNAAVTMEDILSKTDSSFKNDNTTIKPRKGVDPEDEFVTVKIKPRKGVDVMDQLQDIHDPQTTRSKVKPRKGVVQLPLSSTSMLVLNSKMSSDFAPNSGSNVAAHASSRNFNQSSPSYSTQSSDLISVLEQVFRDESDSPETDMKLSTHSVAMSPSNILTVSSMPVSSVQYKTYTTVPIYSSITEQNATSALTESTIMPFHSVLPSKTSTQEEETVVKSTPPLTTVTEHVKFQSKSSLSPGTVEMLSLSHVPVLQTSMHAEYSASSVESTHHFDNSELLFRRGSSSNKAKKPLLATMDDDSENERKYKSSMHLVLSLVFGLLVLFVVLGAVAKRVYDVWMRRHYHRMDFLIDGMYDGFS